MHPLQSGRRNEQGHTVAQRLQRREDSYMRGATGLKHVQERVLDGVHVAGGERHQKITKGITHVATVRLLEDGTQDGHQHAERITKTNAQRDRVEEVVTAEGAGLTC